MRINIDKALTVGAAVSGGVDSMVMLDILIKNGYKVVVINIEHGIRGQSSINDTSFVANFCKENNLEFLTFCVDSLSYSKEFSVSVELAARTLRYNVFDGLLSQGKIDVVALAHHMDDQAETLLLRLFRGSGIKGLSGIKDRNGYVHPLLNYTKAQISDYAAKNSVPFIQDKTNLDNNYTRNFLRNEVIPSIESRYPNLNKTLSKTALIFDETYDFLKTLIIPYSVKGSEVCLPVDILQNSHPLIQKMSASHAIAALGIDKDIETVHLNAILGLINGSNNKKLDLPFNLKVFKEYDNLIFTFSKNSPVFNEEFDINTEYNYKNKEYSFTRASIIEKGCFDLAKIPKGALVRLRQEGDLFKRYGGGTKPLSEYLSDIKMPLRLRDEVLILATDKTVLAVLGIEVSEHIKIDNTTKNIYKITVRELNADESTL